MSDRLFFTLAGVVALCLISLALVWPQGLGARSPAPFGHAMGPADSDQPLAKKPLRKRTPADVAPGALTAPIPVGGRPRSTPVGAMPVGATP